VSHRPHRAPRYAAVGDRVGRRTQGDGYERADRNLSELLQELRVALPGVQVLFGFLLTVPFTDRFQALTMVQERLYFATLLSTALATAFLVAPTANHRLLFRKRDKEHIVMSSNRLATAGVGFLALSICGVILLVSDVVFDAPTSVIATCAKAVVFAWLWFVLPLIRRARLDDEPKPLWYRTDTSDAVAAHVPATPAPGGASRYSDARHQPGCRRAAVSGGAGRGGPVTMRTSARVPALVAAVVLLAGAACGGGSSAPTAVEDKSKAERIVLTSADLPGYTAQAADPGDKESSSIDDCIADNSPLFGVEDNPRGVEGGDYTKDDGNLRVQSGAAIAEKEADAKKAFADVKDAFGGQCIKDGLKTNITEGADPGLKVGDVFTSPLPPFKDTDDSEAIRITVPLEAGGERVSVFVDMTILRQGRTLAAVFTFQTGAPFPDADRTRLVSLVADRMKGKAANSPDTGPPPTTGAASPRPTTKGAEAAGYTAYRDPSGVSLEHPDAWTVEPGGADTPLFVFIDPPEDAPMRRNINVMRQTGDGPLTLDDYTQLSLQQIRDIPGSTISESKPTTLAGSPAYRIAYRADLGSGDFRFLAVWTIRGGEAWLVTYTSDPSRYSEALPEVERVLSTIELST